MPYGKSIAKQYLLIRLAALVIVEMVTFGLMSDLPRVTVDAAITAAIPEFSEAAVFTLVLVVLFQAICSSEEHLWLNQRTPSWRSVPSVDSRGRTIFVVDAHHEDGKRFRCARG